MLNLNLDATPLLTKNSGFTLIELMITIAVMMIFSTVAIPSFQTMIQSNQLLYQGRELTDALRLSRSEAIMRNQAVTLCKSSTGSSCITGNATSWNTGWVSYIDLNRNASIDSGETVLSVHDSLKGDADYSASNSSVGSDYFLFADNGQARRTGGNLIQGSLQICKPGLATDGARISIRPSGKVRLNGTDCP